MYAKLFSSIISSSLWTEDNPTRITFITMLAMADRTGGVYASTNGLARMACLSPVDTEAALAKLAGPDPDSSDLLRNPDNEGRRIERAPGGWSIVNYDHYRSIRDVDERRYQNREAQRRHRSRKVTVGQPASATVSPVIPSDQITSDQNQIKSKYIRKAFVKPTMEDLTGFIFERGLTVDPVAFMAHYDSNGWMVGKNHMKNWKAAVWTWERGIK